MRNRIKKAGKTENESKVIEEESTAKVASKKVRVVHHSRGLDEADRKVTNVTDGTVVLDKKLFPERPFPIDIFPENFQRFVNEKAASMNVEPGLIASLALMVVSGAVGNTIRVRAKGTNEPFLYLWLVIIAESGEGKTQPIRTLLEYVREKESIAMQEYSRACDEYRRGGKAQNSDRPTARRYVVTDTTVAALARIYEHNKRGIIIHIDEISRLILKLGNDRPHYLELFDGLPWTVDRANGTKYITNTGAAIIGGIQPQRLPEVFKRDSIDDGLFPRFLTYVMRGQDTEIDDDTVQSDENGRYWEQLIERCYEIPLFYEECKPVKPRGMKLEEEAIALWRSFRNEKRKIIPLLSERERPFMKKLVYIYSLKFAGLLHIITLFSREGTLLGRTIDKETVEKAIALTEFFAGQAVKTMKLYSGKKLSFDGRQTRLIRTLFDLKDNVKGGELLTKEITATYNKSLPQDHHITVEKTARMMHKMDLKTEKPPGRPSRFVWEIEKMEDLLSDLNDNNRSNP